MLKKYINPRFKNIIKEIEESAKTVKYDVKAPDIIDTTVYDRRTYYLGNERLKKAGVPIVSTPEMREEIQKCKNDIIYFAERYAYIRTLDQGRVIIKLYEYQKEFLRAFERGDINNIMFLAARQSAKSTTVVIAVAHAVIFNEDYMAAIAAQSPSTAHEILSRVLLLFEELPKWMIPGIRVFNRGRCELENGSAIFAGPSKPNFWRGYSVNCLYGKTKIEVLWFGKILEIEIEKLEKHKWITLISAWFKQKGEKNDINY